jgi:iron complex outermembrane recepter protein
MDTAGPLPARRSPRVCRRVLAASRFLAAGLVSILLPAAAAAQSVLPEIEVIATSPLQGAGIERDKVPAMVQTLTSEDFERTKSLSVIETLVERIPGVSTSDVQGNSFVQDVRYRGFVASPVPGTPQGLAVYLNGIRVNEAFGDTVNWDMIPTNAISRADIWTNNPVFGLNALGGAINLGMKNGFTWQGFEADVQGGRFGRVQGGMQYGAQKGDVALYVAAQAGKDDGWRFQSPSELARLYADIGWKGERSEVHLIANGASNFFGVVGPTPVELLARDDRAVYTFPQTTRNQMGLLSLNGQHAVTDTFTVQANTYARRYHQRHVDGNTGEFERCSNASSFPGFLCLEDDGFPRPNPITPAFRNQFVILDQNGKPIPCPPGVGNTCATVPYGTVDRTGTDTWTTGGSAQATSTQQVLGFNNYFTMGGSIDHGRTEFTSSSELGFIFPNLFIGPVPGIPGMGSIIHTLGNVGFIPVGLTATNTYYGVYATDTLDLTSALSVTGGVRLNVANIHLADELGFTPELNGGHNYMHANPVVGATYKVAPGMSVYAGYSQANRTPTPLELGCSNPQRPCLIESALVSDPPLKQVVANTYELGARGQLPVNGGVVEWKLGGFRTDSLNDIVHLASFLQGRGFFANVPATRRQGIEAGVEYRSPTWLAYVNYGFVDATYQFTGDVASPNNPFADDDGDIHVTPGKRIPGIPQHQFKAGADYFVIPEWKVGASLVAVGSQYFVGDDSNQNPQLPAYWYVNLRTSYQLRKDVQLFGVVNNLFDNRFATYGTFFDTSGIALITALTDPRTVTPVQPLSVYGGIRINL